MDCINGCMVRSNLVISLVTYFKYIPAKVRPKKIPSNKMSVLPLLKASKQNSSKLSSSAFVLKWHMRHKIHNQTPNVRSNLVISLVTYFTYRTSKGQTDPPKNPIKQNVCPTCPEGLQAKLFKTQL